MKPKAKARKHSEVWYAVKYHEGRFFYIKKYREHLLPINRPWLGKVKIVEVKVTES